MGITFSTSATITEVTNQEVPHHAHHPRNRPRRAAYAAATAFVLHYLRIEWQERGIARRMEVSGDPIEIEQDDDGHYRAETQMFRDFHPWVGLSFSGQAIDAVPHLISSDGQRQPWLKIRSPEGREWWVQDNGWDQERKTHLSELHRSFGQFELHIGAERLDLVNVALELGSAEAEDYLADFRDELISLALSRQSSATGGLIRSDSTDLVEALSRFAQAARHVLGNPARHLTEIEELQPTGRLRPNNRTFREVLRRPSRRGYPGRGAEETIDIPDNRFVHHMVQYCARLSSRIASASEAQSLMLIWGDRQVPLLGLTSTRWQSQAGASRKAGVGRESIWGHPRPARRGPAESSSTDCASACRSSPKWR